MKEFHLNASTGTQINISTRVEGGTLSTQQQRHRNYNYTHTIMVLHVRAYPKVEQADVSGSTSAGTRYFRPWAPFALKLAPVAGSTSSEPA